MYACLCRAVTDRSVRQAVEAGASTVSEVRVTCGAGTGCGGCLPSLRRLLRECLGAVPAGPGPAHSVVAGPGPAGSELVRGAMARPAPEDTPADTGLADTGLADTGLADTGLADTGLADTGLACTSAAVLDVGHGLNLAPTCSANCAQTVGTTGEPMCVAGLVEPTCTPCDDVGALAGPV